MHHYIFFVDVRNRSDQPVSIRLFDDQAPIKATRQLEINIRSTGHQGGHPYYVRSAHFVTEMLHRSFTEYMVKSISGVIGHGSSRGLVQPLATGRRFIPASGHGFTATVGVGQRITMELHVFYDAQAARNYRNKMYNPPGTPPNPRLYRASGNQPKPDTHGRS